MDVLFIAKWTVNILSLVASAYAYISDSNFLKFSEPFPGPFSPLPASDPCCRLTAASEIEEKADQKWSSPKEEGKGKEVLGRETRRKSIW